MTRSITPLTQQIAEVEIWTGVGGSMDGVVIGLYQAGFNPNENSVWADFALNVANFDGYAASAAVAFLEAGTDAAGLVGAPGLGEQFLPTGVVTPNSIGGWYFRNGAGNQWFAAAALDAPFPIAVTGLEQLTIASFARFKPSGLVYRAGLQVTLLEALTVAMGNLDLNLVKLYKAGYNPSEQSTIAELDANVCDFTGYASIAIVDWNEAGSDPEGFYVVVADTVQFLATGTAASNSVGGYYVTSADGLTLKFCVPLAAPFPMGVTGLEQLPIQATKTFGR